MRSTNVTSRSFSPPQPTSPQSLLDCIPRTSQTRSNLVETNALCVLLLVRNERGGNEDITDRHFIHNLEVWLYDQQEKVNSMEHKLCKVMVSLRPLAISAWQPTWLGLCVCVCSSSYQPVGPYRPGLQCQTVCWCPEQWTPLSQTPTPLPSTQQTFYWGRRHRTASSAEPGGSRFAYQLSLYLPSHKETGLRTRCWQVPGGRIFPY